jgi:hypothetical protein
MFVKKSFADEVFESMERLLVEGAVNKHAEEQSRIVKAADFLNAAAEIFDDVGLVSQAEATTMLIESLAKKKDKKTKKTAPKKKEMTPAEMVENLRTKGWAFDTNDAGDQNCVMCGAKKQDVNQAHDNMGFEDELDFNEFEDRLHGHHQPEMPKEEENEVSLNDTNFVIL